MQNDEKGYMAQAIKEAKKAADRGEVPVGAVLVDSETGDIVAQDGNRVEEFSDPTAHAEVLVIRTATAQNKTPRLPQYDLYVTLEPCPLCATAISFARLRRVYFGAYDPKGGGIDHGARIFNQPTCHHKPEVYGGLNEQDCADLLKDFFRQKR